MKIARIAFLSVAFMIILSCQSHAGELTLGAKASIYNPPEDGASPSLMYGFALDYDINRYFHAIAGASYTSYAAKGVDYTLMPITFDLVAHFRPDSNIDPYLGLGVGYYSKTADKVERSRTGGQAEAGVNFHIGNFNAALEISYIVTDLSDSSIGAVSCGGWASGTSYVWMPF